MVRHAGRRCVVIVSLSTELFGLYCSTTTTQYDSETGWCVNWNCRERIGMTGWHLRPYHLPTVFVQKPCANFSMQDELSSCHHFQVFLSFRLDQPTAQSFPHGVCLLQLYSSLPHPIAISSIRLQLTRDAAQDEHTQTMPCLDSAGMRRVQNNREKSSCRLATRSGSKALLMTSDFSS